MSDESGFFSASNYLQMEDIATALGDMMIAWSRAEVALTNALAVMIGMEEYEASRIYVQLPNFHSSIKLLNALIDVNPKFDPLTRPISKLNRLAGTRNSFVHGFYIYSETGKVRVVDRRVPEEEEGRSKPVSAHDIHQHAHNVRVATKLLTERISPLIDKDGKEGYDLAMPDLRPHRRPLPKSLIQDQKIGAAATRSPTTK